MPNKTATKTVKSAKTVNAKASTRAGKPGRRAFSAKPASNTKKPVVRKPVSPKKSSTPKKPVPTTQAPVSHPATTAAPPVVQQQQTTEAEKIWAEIRFRPIEMFGLPNQTVEQYVAPFPADPNKLFLVSKAPAVLPSLEVACKDFTVELADKFIIVSRTVAATVAPHFPGAPPPPRR